MKSLLSFFGVDRFDAPAPAAQPLFCPRDKTALGEERALGIPMYACAKCDGKWLSGAHAARLFTQLGDPEAALKEFQRQIENESKDSSARCSKDGAAMRVIKQRGVTLDVCTQCRSIWFDGDELAQFLNKPIPETQKVSTMAETGGGMTTTTTVTRSADGMTFSRKTVVATAVVGGALGVAAVQAAQAKKPGDSALGEVFGEGLDLVDLAGGLLELFDF